jgi:ABC-2 type transport system ATP-binding protein
MMSTQTTDALSLRAIVKTYARRPALRGVGLRVGPGEVVGLLGPNGAGKSTLFQIAAGLFAPDEGEVRAFGLSYREDPGAILERLGVVFQARSLDLDISVRANLRFHGGLFGLSGDRLRERITDVCTLLGISDQVDTDVRRLSGGNQRRVEIARAMLSHPSLLLLDEPTTGLDTAARRNLVRDLADIVRKRGVSVLWATHIVEEVASADRIVVLVAGEVRFEGRPTELLTATGTRNLSDAYVAFTASQG